MIHDEIAVFPDDVSLAARLPYDGPGEDGLDRERAGRSGYVEAPAAPGDKRIKYTRERILRGRIGRADAAACLFVFAMDPGLRFRTFGSEISIWRSPASRPFEYVFPLASRRGRLRSAPGYASRRQS